MSAPTQVAVNSAAVLTAAARLEARGYQGTDAAAFVENLLLEAIRSGYRPLEPPPALHGPTSTAAGRKRAREIFEQALKDKGTTNGGTE